MSVSTPTPSANPPGEPGGRISTGVPALDEMLSGGLLPGRPYLVVGPSGTGKTTLALQFLTDGIRRGERCLLVTLEEPPNEIRQNHRELAPELERVNVFDAIPDVMRYERAPFKDIAAVRESVPFSAVPIEIRKTAELTSVEVTFTALEQTLKMETAKRSYQRIVVDSLTALQYFCMKGFDETLGAQTFLRFLSDLRITTLLTVEAPLEDVESPERLLARGEVRLFRWELDGVTVRAVGVEKFRGSQHDIRLHPYRISPRGIDINLEVTISRDTRQVLPSETLVAVVGTVVPPGAESGLGALERDAADIAEVGLPTDAIAEAVRAALKEARSERFDAALREVGRARGLVLAEFQEYRDGPGAHDVSPSARRLAERVASVRAGVPPTFQPAPSDLLRSLETLSARLSRSAAAAPTPPVIAPTAPTAPPPVAPPAAAPSPPVMAPAAPAPSPAPRPVAVSPAAPPPPPPPPPPTRRLFRRAAPTPTPPPSTSPLPSTASPPSAPPAPVATPPPPPPAFEGPPPLPARRVEPTIPTLTLPPPATGTPSGLDTSAASAIRPPSAAVVESITSGPQPSPEPAAPVAAPKKAPARPRRASGAVRKKASAVAPPTSAPPAPPPVEAPPATTMPPATASTTPPVSTPRTDPSPPPSAPPAVLPPVVAPTGPVPVVEHAPSAVAEVAPLPAAKPKRKRAAPRKKAPSTEPTEAAASTEPPAGPPSSEPRPPSDTAATDSSPKSETP